MAHKIALSQRNSGNIAAAQRASAESRQCPKCGRKAALTHYRDDMFSGRYCRWDDCDYTAVRLRYCMAGPVSRHQGPCTNLTIMMLQ